MAADRLDRHIDIFQSEPVRRDLFQWKSFGCDLPECKFARSETVATSALHSDSFNGDLADWEIREIRHLTLHNHGSSAPLQCVYPENNRHGPCAGSTGENDVHSTAPGDFLHTSKRILLLHVDDVVCS